ncbi:MAG: hypothetical protein ACI9FN_003381 [Saprospiraceae bacterium]|jgi:hypothetical protein
MRYNLKTTDSKLKEETKSATSRTRKEKGSLEYYSYVPVNADEEWKNFLLLTKP